MPSEVTELTAAVAALQVEVRHLAAASDRLARANEGLAARVDTMERAETRRRAWVAGAKWAYSTLWAAAGAGLAIAGQWLLKKLGL